MPITNSYVISSEYLPHFLLYLRISILLIISIIISGGWSVDIGLCVLTAACFSGIIQIDYKFGWEIMISAVNLAIVIPAVLGGILFLAALYLVACYIGFYLLVVKPPAFDTSKPNPLMGPDFPAMVKKLGQDLTVLKKLPSEEITVTTRDGLRLTGQFYSASSRVTVVCLHGYGSSGYGDFGSRALGYLRSGYNVLLVNHRHHAKSEGKYIGFGVLDRFDVPVWLNAVNELIPDGEIFISGVSMGGATAMQASCLALPKNVRGIIEDCGYTSVKEEFEFQLRRVIGFVPRLTLKIIGTMMKKIAGYGIDDINSIDAVRESKAPILFIHGDSDIFVPTEMVYRVYDACTTEKELYIVPDCAHAMAEFKGGEEYYKRVNDFILKHSEILGSE